MAKFAIECPRCGKYAEAKTGFFARKKIDCSCGYTIDVRTDKITSRMCPHCGNVVVYDQSKGRDAKCPVCRNDINVMSSDLAAVEVSCAQCGVRLITTKGAETYTCPVCDYVNNVQERVLSEKIKKDGLASIIKYEGDNDTFIWKHPIEDFNYGSQLIVHESQEAIFFKDGQALDLFGPGRYTLETQQLPLLEKTYALPTDTEGTFHSEVYFINKTVQMAVKWGTPDKVRFIDPLTGVPLAIGASGEMNIMVDNSRKLIVKLVGTMKGIAWEDTEGFSKSLRSSFRPLIANAVKTNLPAVIKNEAFDLLEIDEHLDIISENLKAKILPGFEEYGLTIPQFYVTSVVLPEDDPNFKRIRELHTITLQTRMLQAEATVKTAKAQNETMYRTAEEQSKAAIEAARRETELQRQTTETEIAKREAERKIIEAQAQAQADRLAGLTEAEVMAAKGYNQRDVLQAEVQKAYAEGIGNMGPAISSGGGGSSIVGDMMGLGVGMAAAGVVMPQIGQMMQGFGNMGQQPGAGVGSSVANAGNPGAAGSPVAGTGNMGAAGMAAGSPNMNAGGFGAAGLTAQMNGAGFVGGSPAADHGSAGVAGVSAAGTWDCSCGQRGIVGNFCNNCGAKKPSPMAADTWDCACGQKGIIGNFCNNCGAKRPAKEDPETWDCSCGQKGIIGNFCNNCGTKRPVKEDSATWDCVCGQKGIVGEFCNNCGAKKPAKEEPETWDCSCGQKGIVGEFCNNCGKKKGE